VLLWPRGATAAVSAAVADAGELCGRWLRASVLQFTRGGWEGDDDRDVPLRHEAAAAAWTMDDAVRQYLSESGAGTRALVPVVRAFNDVIRVHCAAEMIADTETAPLSAYPRTRAVLETHAEWICERLAGAAHADEPRAHISDEFVLSLRAESTESELALDIVLPLVTVAACLGEVQLVYAKPAAGIPIHGTGIPASPASRSPIGTGPSQS
jgi:hypothetical protein